MNFFNPLALATASLFFAATSYAAPIVSANAGGYWAPAVVQGATSNSFVLDNGSLATSASAYYDAATEKFDIGVYSNAASITLKNQYTYTGATSSEIFYDFHIDADISATYEAMHTDGNMWTQLKVDVLVNGVNQFSRIARAVLAFGSSTLGGLTGYITVPTGPSVDYRFGVSIDHDESLPLGLAANGMVYNIEYRMALTTSHSIWVGGYASDPGLFSSRPSGFRVANAPDPALPISSVLWLFIGGLLLMGLAGAHSHTRQRRTAHRPHAY
jgi:hypothetical protein